MEQLNIIYPFEIQLLGTKKEEQDCEEKTWLQTAITQIKLLKYSISRERPNGMHLYQVTTSLHQDLIHGATQVKWGLFCSINRQTQNWN